MHLNANGNELDNQFKHYLLHTLNRDYYSDCALSLNREQCLYEINYVNAAAWLIRGEILETVGGFDPLFNHYGEDDDYAARLAYHNYKFGILTNAYIFHDRERENNKSNWTIDANIIRVILLKKH